MGREEGHEGGGKRTRGRVRLRRGGAQPDTGERKSRAPERLSSSFVVSSISSWEIRSPRDALPVADVDFGTRRLSAMDPKRRFLCFFFLPFFWDYAFLLYARLFLLHVERERRFRERLALEFVERTFVWGSPG